MAKREYSEEEINAVKNEIISICFSLEKIVKILENMVDKSEEE